MSTTAETAAGATGRTSWRTSPLSISTLGVESLDRSLAFYRDVIGLTASQPVTWSGPEFEQHWQLPAGASAPAALMSIPARRSAGSCSSSSTRASARTCAKASASSSASGT